MTSPIDHLYQPINEITNIFGEKVPDQKEWLAWTQEQRNEYDEAIRNEACFDSTFDAHVEDWLIVCGFGKAKPWLSPDFERRKASALHPMHNACTIKDTRTYLSSRVPQALEQYLVATESDSYESAMIRRKFNFIHRAVVMLGDDEYPIYIYPTQKDGMTRVTFTQNNWRSHKHEDTYTTYYYLVPRNELIPIYERAKVVQDRREALLSGREV